MSKHTPGSMIALALATLVGCGGSGPSGPSEIDSVLVAKHQRAQELVDCHRGYWSFPLEVPVVLTDSVRGSDQAKAWASPQHLSINVVGSYLRGWADVDIEMVMGHELAHVMGTWDEDEATRKASQAYWNARCH